MDTLSGSTMDTFIRIGKVDLRGVRRLNVGGKLLTNYLKECVSYRQWNMMDAFDSINEVRVERWLKLDFHWLK